MKKTNTQTVKILLRNISSLHFCATSFLNYGILIDVFLQCVLNRVLDYSEFPLLVFGNILKVNYFLYPDNDNVIQLCIS